MADNEVIAEQEKEAAASKMVLSIVKINLESVFSLFKQTKGQDVLPIVKINLESVFSLFKQTKGQDVLPIVKINLESVFSLFKQTKVQNQLIPDFFKTYPYTDKNITILYKDIGEDSDKGKNNAPFNIDDSLLKSYNYLIYINNGKIDVFKIKRYYNLKYILKNIYIYKDIIIISKKDAFKIDASKTLYQYNKYLSINLIFIYKNIGENDINNLPKFKKQVLNKNVNSKTIEIDIDTCMEIKKIIKKKEVLIIVKNNLINVISSLNIRKV